MFQALDCELFLYADGSCLVYQHRDVKVIDTRLNKIFSNVWFAVGLWIANLGIHFGEDKTKCILFDKKRD